MIDIDDLEPPAADDPPEYDDTAEDEWIESAMDYLRHHEPPF